MGSFAQGALIERTTSTTNTGGTTSLVYNSTTLQRFTGSVSQIIELPDATTLLIGRYFIIENESSNDITVNYNNGTLAAYVASGTQRSFELFGNSSVVGDWVVGNQLDINGPLSLYASRPNANTNLNIKSNQLTSGAGTILSTAPIDDVIYVFPDTYINMVFYAQTGGVYGGTVYTEGGTFIRPSVISGEYVRLVFSYISALNVLNTKFSTSSVTQSGLTNPGTLFTSIEGTPIGYIDLKSLGSWNFCTANSSSSIIENKNIVNFSAGTGSNNGGDTSFKFLNISSNILTIKKGFLILYDGRELYAPSDFTVDLTTAASVDGNYYGYIDLYSLDATPVYLNGRKLYQVTSSNIYFSTNTPDTNSNFLRFIPLGVVQRSSGTWLNQQTTALRRHDNMAIGVDASLEYSTGYTTIGVVGSADQIKAGHILDSYSFPTSISSSNISWYNLTNASDNSTNSRNLTPIGSPLFTDLNILGVAATFAPDGVNDYLLSPNSFFLPSAASSFAFGLWINADNYSLGTQVLVSNWGTGNKSYKLQLNAGNLEFVTSVDGTAEVTTVIYNASLLPALSGWNHLAVSYNSTGTLYSFYLNSDFLMSTSIPGRFAGTSTFNLAAANGGSFFAGAMDEFFFINGSYLTQEAVSKIYSTKITHNRNLVPISQRWSATITDTNTDIEKQLFTDFTVDIHANFLYANFSNQTSTDKIALKMHNIGNIGISKPIKSRTLIVTAAELDAQMPLSHNLSDVPYLKLQVDEGSFQFSTHNDASYFIATTTQILSTGTTLTSVLGANTPVRLTYSVGGESINSRLVGGYIIVGSHPDADFLDLWTALPAVTTVTGPKILVVSDQSTSISRTISNSDIYIEFLPGVKITSTVASSYALTFSGSGIITNNLTLLLQGNADGVLFTSTATSHNNFTVEISSTVNNVLTFDTSARNNSIEANIQLSSGTFSTPIVNNATVADNDWTVSTPTNIYTSTKLRKIRTIATNSLVSDDDIVLLNSASALPITLPSVFLGKTLSLKNINTGLVTITPASGTIDGLSTTYLNQYDSLLLGSDGTNWHIVQDTSRTVRNIRTIVTDSLTVSDDVVFINSATNLSITLPTLYKGKILTLKNINTGIINITGTVDGTTFNFLNQYESFVLGSDGSSWYIIQDNRTSRKIRVLSTAIIAADDYTVLVNSVSPVSVILPAPSFGKIIIVKNINTGAASVIPSFGNIDGGLSYPLNTQYKSVTLQSDGINWFVIGAF